MKTTEKKRTYQMLERAEQVARNNRKIMDAMAELWLEMPLSELTLDKVAQRSGVSDRSSYESKSQRSHPARHPA